MSASVLYMSMSLDGYIAGPNDEVGNPSGDGFNRLHEWFCGTLRRVSSSDGDPGPASRLMRATPAATSPLMRAELRQESSCNVEETTYLVARLNACEMCWSSGYMPSPTHLP
jgi:hypothetical protein